MNPIRRIVAMLTGLAAATLALTAASPAFAMQVPPPGTGDNLPSGLQHLTPAHVVVTGGMAGWQITLIAVGAALLAATLAVITDRARTARRRPARTA